VKAIPSSNMVPKKIRPLPETIDIESEDLDIVISESARNIRVLVSVNGEFIRLGFKKAYKFNEDNFIV
jgi:hypothetical protein